MPDLTVLARFFSKVGALTFGGGITVLAFVHEQVVNQLQWLSAQEFLDGLALGQLTPGPLLMLAAYIGFKTAGLTGGVVSACAIFLPAFILMLCLLPVLHRFKDVGWLKAAMKGTMPAVIGILAVSLVTLIPHAAPDVYTGVLLVFAIAAMTLWRLAPLSLILAGAMAGVVARIRPLQRLRELV
ncbi:MAG: chromate transporter [Pseudomonadota bacterium]